MTPNISSPAPLTVHDFLDAPLYNIQFGTLKDFGLIGNALSYVYSGYMIGLALPFAAASLIYTNAGALYSSQYISY